ncbi:MAG: response regulator transcription factor, partial [Gemmatimonadaceae bacterium]
MAQSTHDLISHVALDAQPSQAQTDAQAPRKIRVILADDHRIVREGLRALLSLVPDIDVVGEADCGPAAVALARECAPDVVVMDLNMPGGSGADATRQLTSGNNPIAVLVLTMHDEAEYLVTLLECGARGFLTKDAAERELEDAIRSVAAGQVYVRPHVAQLLAAQVGGNGNRSAEDSVRTQYEKLSARERDVLH